MPQGSREEGARLLEWQGGRDAVCRCAVWLVAGLLGCRIPPPPSRDDLSRDWSRQESVAVRTATELARRRAAGEIAESNSLECDSFFDSPDLTKMFTMDEFVSEVLRVNPDLEASEAAWKAALELYPQAASWKDPNFRFQNGPTIFGASQGAHLWRLQIAQEIPWFGKTGLRGELADRTADVAHYEWRRSRQELVGLARQTYLQYALSERLQELQQQDYRLAQAALKPASDVAQAAWDLESLAQRETEELEWLQLEQQNQETLAVHQRKREQMNVLLHRDLSASLPPVILPAAPMEVADFETLVNEAILRSPQLAIARQREEQAEASRGLAEKDFYPDVKVVGRFDTNASRVWAPETVSLKPQLGIYLDPPIRQSRRWARLREAELTKRRRQAETRAIVAAIRGEIQKALTELRRSEERIASLDRLIAAAQRRVKTREMLVATHDHDSKQHVNAQRTVLKYQMQGLQARVERMQRLNELATLTGEDAWVGNDPATEAGEWRSSIQFLPSPANDWMDAMRAFRSES